MGLDLDTFGEIVDGVLTKGEVSLLVIMSKGSMEAEVRDNAGNNSALQFYILLHALESVLRDMVKDMEIGVKSRKWAITLDNILDLVRADLTEDLQETCRRKEISR